jgi:WD40 repeat protein
VHPSVAELLSPTPEVEAHLGGCPSCRRLAGLGDPAPPGRYQRLGPMHRGGMGRTVRAHDRVLGREVLLKELAAPPGLDAERLRPRFEREARLTARLTHPAVLPIYDLGAGEDGTPFYAMPHIEGHTLTAVIAAEPSAAARVALVRHMAVVAAAVAFAHDQGVVHRDLKPENVLVGRFGQVVVIDWGLAAFLGEADAGLGDAPDDGLTRFGLGTPAYMPPEQAAGAPADPRHDVYALGATLYHVLAGVPPYHGVRSDGIRQRLGAGPPESLHHLAPDTPPELLTRVDRARARAPADRFADASELAAELERFVEGRLLTSHPYTTTERIVRFVRNNRPLVGTVGAAAAAGLVLAGWSAREVAAARDRAELELEGSLAAESTLLASRPERTADALVAGLAAFRLAEAAGRAPAPATVEALRIGLRSGPTARRVPELRGWGPRGRAGDRFYATDGLATVWTVTAGAVEGQPIATGQPEGTASARDGRVVIWSATTAAALGPLGALRDVTLPLSPTVAAFVGEHLVLSDGRSLVWVDGDGVELRRSEGASAITALGALGADLLVGDVDGVVRRVGADGVETARWSVGGEAVAALVSGADQAFVGTNDGAVTRLTAQGPVPFGHTTGPAELLETAGPCVLYGALDSEVTLAPIGDGGCARRSWAAERGAPLSPDGKAVAVVTADRICTWDTASGVRRACAPTPPGTIGAGWVDDRVVFSIGFSGMVVWDGGAGEGGGLAGHDAELVALASIGGQVASVARDGTLRLQDPDTGAGVEPSPLDGGVSAVATTADQLAIGSYTGGVSVWSAAGVTALPGAADGVGGLAFSPDGHLAVGTFGGDLAIYDADHQRTLQGVVPGGIRQLVWGEGLVALGTDGKARRLDPTGAVAETIGAEGTLGFAAIGADGTVWLRDRDGTFAWRPGLPRLEGRLVGIGPDGTIVTTTADGAIHRYTASGAADGGWGGEAVIPRRVTEGGFVLGGEGAFWTLDGQLAGRAPRPLTDAIEVAGWLVLGDVDGGVSAEPIAAATARDRACQRLLALGVVPEACRRR